MLVHAAAGGVGLLLTQIVKRRGGARDRDDVDGREGRARPRRGRRRGRRLRGFAERARELTGGEGVARRVRRDRRGRRSTSRWRRCGRAAYMVLYGAASGQAAAGRRRAAERGGSLFLTRPTLAALRRRPATSCASARARCSAGSPAGELDVRIGGRYPLAEARSAQEDLEARRTTGKLLLLPR